MAPAVSRQRCQVSAGGVRTSIHRFALQETMAAGRRREGIGRRRRRQVQARELRDVHGLPLNAPCERRPRREAGSRINRRCGCRRDEPVRDAASPSAATTRRATRSSPAPSAAGVHGHRPEPARRIRPMTMGRPHGVGRRGRSTGLVPRQGAGRRTAATKPAKGARQKPAAELGSGLGSYEGGINATARALSIRIARAAPRPPVRFTAQMVLGNVAYPAPSWIRRHSWSDLRRWQGSVHPMGHPVMAAPGR